MIDLSTLSLADLNTLIADASAEIARRSTKVRIAVAFDSYNSRRYGRPWIATVSSWPVGGRPELSFGGYLGTDQGGEAEIMTTPGAIVRYGQKDGRGHGGSNEWAVVEQDGTLRRVDQTEARKLYR